MKLLVGYMIDGRNSGIDKYLLRVLSIAKRADLVGDVLADTENDALRKCLAPFGFGIIALPALTHPLRQYREMRRVLRQGNYDMAYFNISEPMNCIGAMAAHRAGIKRVVIHSHNTSQGETGKIKGLVKRLLNAVARTRLHRWGTDFYACSHAAGQWLFPKSVLRSDRYRVIYNPVSVDEFAYDPQVRHQVRKTLGLEGQCVLGHIGNFVPAKNSLFLLEVLRAVQKRIPEAVLLSVGDGPQRLEVEAGAQALGLGDSVRFLGIREDVPKLLQGMDFFLLPSLFEGLPVSAVEAQMAGLCCLISDRVTREVQITEDCRFVSIQHGPVPWAEAIVGNLGYKRVDMRTCREAIRPFDLEAQRDEICSIFYGEERTE